MMQTRSRKGLLADSTTAGDVGVVALELSDKTGLSRVFYGLEKGGQTWYWRA